MPYQPGKEDVSTRKTVQIDSFDAKFLDINTLSRLIYERKSFVIENVSDVSETVKRVEHEIEKTKLSCRVYTEYRSTALAGSLWSPTVILGVASAVAIGVHNLSTWNPDYEIGKNYIKRRLSVKYKKGRSIVIGYSSAPACLYSGEVVFT